jgi:hypothetical protein
MHAKDLAEYLASDPFGECGPSVDAEIDAEPKGGTHRLVLISYPCSGISASDPEGFRTLYGRSRYHREGQRMKHLDCSLTAPAALLIDGLGFALFSGMDPWPLAKTTVICLPSAAYVLISHGLWLTTGQDRRGFWHGGSLALYAALTAAGFWTVLVTRDLQRWLGSAS